MTRPVTVVHLTLGLDVGGQEKLLVEFARHADRARHAEKAPPGEVPVR